MIRGLGDYKKEKDDDKKKKSTNSYAGGEKSGLAVEHPDDLENIMEQARQGGRQHQQEGGATDLKITLYSNGFVVADGPFRSYEAEESKEFMKELN